MEVANMLEKINVDFKGEIKQVSLKKLMEYLIHTRRTTGRPFWSEDAAKFFIKDIKGMEFKEKDDFFKYLDDFSEKKLEGESSLWIMENMNDEYMIDQAYEEIKKDLGIKEERI